MALALPALECFGAREAYGVIPASAKIKRVLIFHFPNGVHFPMWTPSGAASLPKGQLAPLPASSSPILSVLDDRGLRQDVIVLSGLSNWEVGSDTESQNGVFAGHDTCAPTLLTGASPSKTADGISGGTGISVDQVIAQAWQGTGVVADSVSLIPRHHSFGADSLHHVFSYTEAGQPIDPLMNPADFFNKFFLSSFDPAAFERLKRSKLAMLDYLGDSIQEVKAACSSSDLKTLDQYLTTVHELSSKSLTSVQAGQCQLGLDWPSRATSFPLMQGQKYTSAEVKLWTDLTFEMLTSAMQCDLVPIVTVSINHSAEQDWYWPDLDNLSDHQISHLQISQDMTYLYGNTEAEARLTAASRWKLERFCDLLDRMKSTILADGRTLLDDTAVVCFSEYSSGPLHTSLDLPVLVAGGGLTGAQQMSFDCAYPPHSWSDADHMANAARCTGQSYTPLANLWLTLIRAAGIDAASRPSLGNSTGTLPNLWI